MDDERRGRLEPLSFGRLAALLVAILALAVIVVSASRPGEAGPAAPPSSAATEAAVFRAAIILFAIAEAGVVGLVIWALLPNGKPAQLQARRRPLALAIIASFLQLAGAALLVWYYLHSHATLGSQTGHLFANFRRPHPLPTVADLGGALAGQEWLTALIVIAVLAVAAGFVLRGARFRGRRSPLARLATQLREAVEEGLDELETDSDARRAVIAAYARMERSLARVGSPRAPHEAALEYLYRLLALLDVGGPAVRRLTELFQLAKFSDHVIDGGMQREAIHALAEIRDDLRARAAQDEFEPRTVPA
jgi:hypothetical protein